MPAVVVVVTALVMIPDCPTVMSTMPNTAKMKLDIDRTKRTQSKFTDALSALKLDFSANSSV